MNKVALGIDLRGRVFEHLWGALDDLSERTWIIPHILFLDAKDSTLVTRYKETRRSHPLAPTGLPLKGIEAERNLLTDMKARANIVLDTSDLKPKELREKLFTCSQQKLSKHFV